MKKKQKKLQPLPKPLSAGTPVTGAVYVNYVQFNVPGPLTQSVVEAMSQSLLSDYHRQFCGNNGAGNE